MRLLFLLTLVLGAVSCGASEKKVCEHNCRETRVCLVSNGILPSMSQQVCLDNCLAGLEDEAIAEVAFKAYDRCGERDGCDWVDCLD